MNNFLRDVEKGKIGEKAVADYFRSRQNIVTDVSNDKEYQKQDIDLLMENPNGNKCSLEVKTDNRISQTGNLLFEVGNNRKTGYKQGWVKYCKADYICFYDNCGKCGYILDWNKTKEVLAENSQPRTFFNFSDSCYSDIRLLALSTARKLGLISHSFSLAA